MLSVLVALGICVGYMWCLEYTYVLAVCGLGAHLVLSVLAALGICVGYMWCKSTYVLAICVVGCLARTWCKR